MWVARGSGAAHSGSEFLPLCYLLFVSFPSESACLQSVKCSPRMKNSCYHGDSGTMKDETGVTGWGHLTGKLPTADIEGQRKQEPGWRPGMRSPQCRHTSGICKGKVKERKGTASHSEEERAN